LPTDQQYVLEKWFGKTQPSVGDQIVGDFDAQRVLDLYNLNGKLQI